MVQSSILTLESDRFTQVIQKVVTQPSTHILALQTMVDEFKQNWMNLYAAKVSTPSIFVDWQPITVSSSPFWMLSQEDTLCTSFVDGCRGVNQHIHDSQKAILEMEKAGVHLIASVDVPNHKVES